MEIPHLDLKVMIMLAYACNPERRQCEELTLCRPDLTIGIVNVGHRSTTDC